MIGSISKVRPCGNHHYYKYAHAKTALRGANKQYLERNDLFYISNDYINDLNEEGKWGPFSLENITTCAIVPFGNNSIKKFEAKTPKLKDAHQFFNLDGYSPAKNITEVIMDYQSMTNVESLFHTVKLKDLPENFNPATRSFQNLFNGGAAQSIANAHGGVFPFYQVINEVTSGPAMFCLSNMHLDDNYTFENVTNGGALFFANSHNGMKSMPKKLSLKNITNMESFCACNGNNPSLTSFQTVDELSKLTSAKNAFSMLKNFHSLYPDYDSFSWPLLSAADNMFNKCILDKPSIIKLSNALPDWSNDTATHNITIGCHIDHKYDPEVNLALKKLQSSYVTPIEELGGSLSETVTSDKKWTIIVQWNGTATENAYPAPTV